MKTAVFRLALLFSMAACIENFVPDSLVQTAFAQSTAQPAPAKPILKGFPFTNETLSYSANWPSGISLGEAHLSATSGSGGWRFELGLDAGIPGFTVKDTYKSTSSVDLCS